MKAKRRIEYRQRPLPEMDTSDYRGVGTFIEQRNGEVMPVSWELAGAGRPLADKLGVKLTGVLLGHNIETMIEQAKGYGFDQIIAVDHPLLAFYRTQAYNKALAAVVQRYKPEIFLLGATSLGRDLGGTVATELATGITADCTQLDVDEDKRLLEASRPTFTGKQMATILCREHAPQMATVRPQVMEAPQWNPEHEAEVIWEEVELTEDEINSKVLDFIPDLQSGAFLDRADVIVAGGMGLGSKENYDRHVRGLADVLNASVGASLPVVQAGWIDHDHQVGQTGTTVRPRVYIAIGISGAIQHIVGMKNSDVIIAINEDPDAPIFDVATYGIVGDLFELVPRLTQALKQKLGQPGSVEKSAGTLV